MADMGTLAELAVAVSDNTNRSYFCAVGSDTNVTANDTVKAKPTDGEIYLESVTVDMNPASAGDTFTVNDDDAAIIGPISVASSGPCTYQFLRPIKLTANLKIDQSVAAPITVIAEGFTVP